MVPEATPSPVLQLAGLECGYGRRAVLNGVDMVVCGGEAVCLLGENGTGKSTLLKAVAGLIPLTAGTVDLGDDQISSMPPHRRCRIGVRYVPQRDVVFEDLSVHENLLLGAHWVPRADRRASIATAVEVFPQLKHLQRRRAGALSGGERQMVAVARALIGSLEILILDEPSAGLSPKYVGALYAGLTKVRERGTPILFAEQSVAKALEFADRAYVLERGKIALEGASADLRANAEFRARYVRGAFRASAEDATTSIQGPRS